MDILSISFVPPLLECVQEINDELKFEYTKVLKESSCLNEEELTFKFIQFDFLKDIELGKFNFDNSYYFEKYCRTEQLKPIVFLNLNFSFSSKNRISFTLIFRFFIFINDYLIDELFKCNVQNVFLLINTELNDDVNLIDIISSIKNKDAYVLVSSVPDINGIEIKALADFKAKLIRKVGFFKRNSKQKEGSYDRCFYDGSACEGELATLLKIYLDREEFQGDKNILILYDSQFSNWIELPVKCLLTKNIACVEINSVISEYKNFTVLNKYDIFICVYPFVNTKHTLEQHSSFLNKKVDNFDVGRNVYFLSSLIQGNTDVKDLDKINQQKLNLTYGNINLTYFFKVEKSPLSKEASTKFDLLATSSKYDLNSNHDCLTSPEFWYLIDNEKLSLEIDVPSYRESAGYLPNLDIIFEKYGGWFCGKIITRLKRKLNDEYFEFNNYVIVTPDEVNINKITDSIKYFSDFNLVRIPRLDIDGLNGKLIFPLLENFSNKVIILDDFTKTGNTIKNMRNVLDSLGKEIIASFAIFSFLNDEEFDVESLYEIPISEKVVI